MGVHWSYHQMRGAEMLVIVGLSVLLSAAIADAASSTRVGHPPTEIMRVRLSPPEVDRHDVPLSDHGRRGGAARTARTLDWLPVHRGLNARRAADHIAFTNRAHDTRLVHQERADTAARSPATPNAHRAGHRAETYQSEGPIWPPTQPL